MLSHHQGSSSDREKQLHHLIVILLVIVATVIAMVVIPKLSGNLDGFQDRGTVFAEELDQGRSKSVDWAPRRLKDKVAHELMPELDPSLFREYR